MDDFIPTDNLKERKVRLGSESNHAVIRLNSVPQIIWLHKKGSRPLNSGSQRNRNSACIKVLIGISHSLINSIDEAITRNSLAWRSSGNTV